MDPFPFYRNFTKYIFDVSVRLTEYSVTVGSVTLRFYYTSLRLSKASKQTLLIHALKFVYVYIL